MSSITLYKLAQDEVRRLSEECFPCNNEIYVIKSDNVNYASRGLYYNYVEKILKENGYPVIERFGQFFKLAK